MKNNKPVRLYSTKILLICICVLLVLGFFESCLKDIKDIKKFSLKEEWKPELAFPLINANFDLEKFLKQNNLDSVFTIHSDNFISIVYKSGVFHARAKDYIYVPTQKFNVGPFKTVISGKDSMIFPFDLKFSKTLKHEIKFQNEEISKIVIKRGKLIVDFKSTFQKSGYAMLQIPAITKNGFEFNDTLLFNTDTAYSFSILKEIDLSGFEIDLSEKGTTYNSLLANYAIRLYKSDDYVRTYDNASFELTLNEIEFEYIEGYLGFHTFEFRNDTTNLDVFKNAEVGRVHFENPQLKLNVYNSFGIPVRLINPIITTVSENYGNTQLNALIFKDPLEIKYPLLNEAGQLKVTEAFMNKTNSNISDMISKTPQHMIYSFDIQTNHKGKTHNNFAFDTSQVKVEFETILPLYGRTGKWVIEDAFDYKSIDLGPIEAVQFNLTSKNSFPFEAFIQIYFIDSNNVILDSLITSDPYILKAGITDFTGRVTNPTKKTTIIELSNEQLSKLGNIKKVRLQAGMSTKNQGKDNVRIFSHYNIDISLSSKVKAKPNEFFKN